MPKLFYPFDAQAFWLRVALVTGFAAMLLLATGAVISVNLDIPREVSAPFLIVPLLALMIWEIVLPMRVRQRAEDGLWLDDTGLTRVHAGKEERWPWQELSEFRLHGRWHPACLFIGRPISFRGPSSDSGSRLVAILNRIVLGGRNMVFGDNYLAISDNLAERLNFYRAMALGELPKPDEVPQTFPGSALFFARDALDSGKRSKAAAALLAGIFASAVITVFLAMLHAEALPDSLAAILADKRLAAALFPAFFIVLQSTAQHFWQVSPASNLILAGAGGLHSRKGLQRKFWLWDEIRDIAVTKAPPIAAGESVSLGVSFTALHDGSKPGRPTAAEAGHEVVSAFQDIYETPAGDIAKQLVSWLRWSEILPFLSSGITKSEALPARKTGHPAAPMRFARLMSRRTGAFRGPAMAFFWVYPPLVLLAIYSVGTMDLPKSIALALLAALAFSTFGVFGFLMLATGSSFNYLEVSDSGLVYRRLGRRRVFPWHELGQLERYDASLRWSRELLQIILFVVPEDDRLSRFTRWAYMIDGAQSRVVIEDVYEIAVSELLQILRRRSRRGG